MIARKGVLMRHKAACSALLPPFARCPCNPLSMINKGPQQGCGKGAAKRLDRCLGETGNNSRVISTPQPLSNPSHSPASLSPQTSAPDCATPLILLQKAFFISDRKLGAKGGGCSFRTFHSKSGLCLSTTKTKPLYRTAWHPPSCKGGLRFPSCIFCP